MSRIPSAVMMGTWGRLLLTAVFVAVVGPASSAGALASLSASGKSLSIFEDDLARSLGSAVSCCAAWPVSQGTFAYDDHALCSGASGGRPSFEQNTHGWQVPADPADSRRVSPNGSRVDFEARSSATVHEIFGPACESYATRGLPQIVARTGPGAYRAMLGEAVGHVKALSGTAAEKANLFQSLASQISAITKGGWQAVRGTGTGGSHVFLGGQGEALIIDSAGAVFRGSLGNGVGLGAKLGEFAVDFAKLRPL